MSNEMLIRCCAPTMASLKTGNMFNCPFAGKEEMIAELRRLNQVLAVVNLPDALLADVDDLLVVKSSRVGRLVAQHALDDVGVEGVQPVLLPDGPRLNQVARVVACAPVVVAHVVGQHPQPVEPVVQLRRYLAHGFFCLCHIFGFISCGFCEKRPQFPCTVLQWLTPGWACGLRGQMQILREMNDSMESGNHGDRSIDFQRNQ